MPSIEGYAVVFVLIGLGIYTVARTGIYVAVDEHIRSRINQSIATDCRTLWPCTASSTAYKIFILYAVDEDLCGRNVLHSVAMDRLILLCICPSRSISCYNVAMSLYNII